MVRLICRGPPAAAASISLAWSAMLAESSQL
jgi:hypothetical protein